MITFDLYSKHNFLGPSWYKHFKEVGLDMGIDASYYLVKDDKVYRIYDKGEFKKKFGKDFKDFSEVTVIPTYTIADMLYKIDEWPCDNSNDKPWKGIGFFKDAPFYCFCYAPKLNDDEKTGDPEEDKKLMDEKFPTYQGHHWIEPSAYTPIESIARLLYICLKENYGYNKHNISDKYKELENHKFGLNLGDE
jgi:hypothetical protein